MKTIYKYLLCFVAVVALAACSKDDPFPGQERMGALSTRALLVELQNEENIIKPSSPKKLPKFATSVDKKDFDISIFPEGSDEAYATYKYSDMPEIITLPVGKYVARASFGENQDAAFDAPYFKGEKSFEIFENQVTDNIGTITAKFSNVRVTILFDPVLVAHMSADSKVTVKVGDKGSLEFTKDDQSRSGYFAFVENSNTLAAEFSGLVDGTQDSKVTTFNNVAPGNHYRITFRLANFDDLEQGDLNGSLNIDTTIEKVDMNLNVDSEWETIDDDRNQTVQPEDPDKPNPPVGDAELKIEPVAPISFDKVNEVNSSSKVVINITSKTGIEKFQVKIHSEVLDGLVPDVLDLVNPGENLEFLVTLGLLSEDQPSLKGLTTKAFDISGFMSMLQMLGTGNEHTFELIIGDASGEQTKNLVLRTIND